ncbi:MAG: aminopeptidase [Phycisphaerales bacterium]|nr:MAG: aminopeptidase [Phycisphaerales bacterium]
MTDEGTGRLEARTPFTAVVMTLLVTLVCPLTGACGGNFAYYIPAAIGQLDLMLNSVPLSQALSSSSLSEEQLLKLELIRDVREYARNVIGLDVGDNFAMFYDSGGEAVAFNISASRKDAFEPKRWTFPIVGTLPYLGYFDSTAADAKFDELVDEGLDVYMYQIDAYSGLEYFPNLVLSPMLERSDISLVDTVIHELLHSTIWRPNNTSFNESLATFFGRTGALRFFADRYPDDPEFVEGVAQRFEDTDRYNDAMKVIYDELDAFFSSDLTSEEKLAGREEVYQAGRDWFMAEVHPLMNQPDRFDWVANLPTNNAWMLGVRRYNLDLDVFEEVFAATGEDWAQSLYIFRAAASESDPYAYLRSWLETITETPES